MRIRTQTILGITPIFTLLGAAISLLVYTTERAEVIWGIEEEAASLAISIAEFVSLDRPNGGVEEFDSRSTSERLDAVLKFQQLKRVRFFETKGSQLEPVWDRGNDKFDPTEEPSAEEVGKALGKGIWIANVETSTGGLPIARALSPVRGETGETFGVLEAITDASRLEVRTRRIIWRGINITVALTLIGILLSLGVSTFLTKRLARLDRAARIVAQGDYDQEINLRSIQEVNDLGSTFNTMSSIIQDTITKAKTQLVESDQFRNPVDLAVTCWKLNRQTQHFETGSLDLLIGTAGNTPSGSFAGLVNESGGPAYGMAGSVNESVPLEAAANAAAAMAYLFRLLKDGRNPEESLGTASEVFDFSACRIYECREEDTITCWSLSADGIHSRSIALESELPAVFTTGSEESAEKISQIIGSTGRASHENVRLLLSDDEVVAYAVLQKTSA